MTDAHHPDERPEETTWLVDAVHRLHAAPDEALSPEQLANLLHAHPELQPRFELDVSEDPADEASDIDDEPNDAVQKPR